jgi:hypothetical protein
MLCRHLAEMSRSFDTGIPEPLQHETVRKIQNQYPKFDLDKGHWLSLQNPHDPGKEIRDGLF